MASPTDPDFIKEVLASFGPRTTDASRAIGVPNSTLDTWKRKGQIPGWRWAQIEAAAGRLQIKLPEGFSEAARAAADSKAA